ncbi:MAG: hypothetical protein ACP5VE_06240 [Chthonomonadales bacterium]
MMQNPRQPAFGPAPAPPRRLWRLVAAGGIVTAVLLAWGMMRSAGTGGSMLLAPWSTAAAPVKPGLVAPERARAGRAVPGTRTPPASPAAAPWNPTAIYSSPASPPPASPTERPGNEAPSASGMFTERPSALETPTVRIRNDTSDILTLTLIGSDGRAYQLAVPPFGVNSMQVPAGQYAAEVSGLDPNVHPAIGDATFRKRHEYEDTFITVPRGFAGPLHMGD